MNQLVSIFLFAICIYSVSGAQIDSSNYCNNLKQVYFNGFASGTYKLYLNSSVYNSNLGFQNAVEILTLAKAGYYSLTNQTSSFNFNLSDCGTYYGPGDFKLPPNYCNNLKTIPITQNSSSTIYYYLYKQDDYDDYLEYFYLYSTSGSWQITRPGNYSLISWKNSDIIIRYDITIPDCGTYYGPGNFSIPANFCNNLKAVPITQDRTSTIYYYLFKVSGVPDFTTDYFESFYVYSLSESWKITRPGTYSLVSWKNGDHVNQDPIIRYDIEVPNCGSYYGPGNFSIPSNFCNNLKSIPITQDRTDTINYYLYKVNDGIEDYSEYFEFFYSYLLSASWTITRPGNYTLISWKNGDHVNQDPIIRYDIHVPDCGTYYGPGNFSIPVNYCSNLKVIPITQDRTSTINYYLYEIDGIESPDFADYFEWFYTYSLSDSWTITRPGNYILASWKNSDRMDQDPVIRYDIQVPDCGIYYGPGNFALPFNYCNNLKFIPLTQDRTSSINYYLYKINGTQNYQNYFEWFYSYSLQSGYAITRPGNYTLASWKNGDRINQDPIIRYDISIPDCGSYYGPGNFSIPSNYCNNLKSIPITQDRTSTLYYYLYKISGSQQIDYTNYFEYFYVSSYGDGWRITKPGNYTLASWRDSDHINQDPLIRYDIVVPDCGSYYGPGNFSIPSNFCNNLKAIPITQDRTSTLYYYLYKISGSQQIDFTNYFEYFYVSSYGDGWRITKPGNYTLASWKNSDRVDQDPIIRYDIHVPDCGYQYGPVNVSIPSICNATVNITQTFSGFTLYYYVYQTRTPPNYDFSVDNFWLNNMQTTYLMLHSGKYSITSWKDSDRISQDPILRYDVTLPECFYCGDGYCASKAGENITNCFEDCCPAIIDTSYDATFCIAEISSPLAYAEPVEIFCKGINCESLRSCRFNDVVVPAIRSNETLNFYCVVPPEDPGIYTLSILFDESWFSSPEPYIIQNPENITTSWELVPGPNSTEKMIKLTWNSENFNNETIDIQVFAKMSNGTLYSTLASTQVILAGIPNTGSYVFSQSDILGNNKREEFNWWDLHWSVKLEDIAFRFEKQVKGAIISQAIDYGADAAMWALHKSGIVIGAEGNWCGFGRQYSEERAKSVPPTNDLDRACQTQKQCDACVSGSLTGSSCNYLQRLKPFARSSFCQFQYETDIALSKEPCANFNNTPAEYAHCQAYAKLTSVVNFALGFLGLVDAVESEIQRLALKYVLRYVLGMGDVHYVTAGGRYFTYMGLGEFYAVMPPDLKLAPVIQVRAEYIHGSNYVTVTTGIVVRSFFGQSRVAIYSKRANPLYIDGESVRLSLKSSFKFIGGYVTRTENYKYDVTFDNGLELSVTISYYYMSYIFNIVPAIFGSQGILGSIDEHAYQLITRNQTSVSDSDEFGDSWKISCEESLFDYFDSENCELFNPPLNPNHKRENSILQIQSRDQSEAEQFCKTFTSPNKEACLYDFVAMNASASPEILSALSVSSSIIESHIQVANLTLNVSLISVHENSAGFSVRVDSSLVTMDVYLYKSGIWQPIWMSVGISNIIVNKLDAGTSYQIRVRAYPVNSTVATSWTFVSFLTSGCTTDCTYDSECGIDKCGNPCGYCAASKICSGDRKCIDTNLAPSIILQINKVIQINASDPLILHQYVNIITNSNEYSVVLYGIPNDFKLSDGTKISNGSWIFSSIEFNSLAIILAQRDATINITINTTVFDTKTHLTASSSGFLSIKIQTLNGLTSSALTSSALTSSAMTSASLTSGSVTSSPDATSSLNMTTSSLELTTESPKHLSSSSSSSLQIMTTNKGEVQQVGSSSSNIASYIVVTIFAILSL